MLSIWENMSGKVDFTDLKDLDENSNPGVGVFWLIAVYGPAVIVLIISIWNFYLATNSQGFNYPNNNRRQTK